MTPLSGRASKPRVIVIGAGFGGLYTAYRLLPYVRKGLLDVTVVNRNNYFLFTPLLHEVATGGLSPRSVAEPLREIFAGSGVEIVKGEVEAIDADARRVRVGGRDIPYDRVVVASGAVTNHYGIPGAEEHGLPLKDLADALRIRGRVIEAFERAADLTDSEARRRALSFVVVGGGATGVEVAAELLEFARGIERRHHRQAGRAASASVSLVSAAPELLAQFHPKLREAAAARLRRQGVDVRLGAQVASVDAEALRFADGTELPGSVIVWAAGVKPSLPDFVGRLPKTESGRLRVASDLKADGLEGVYALGDAAAVVRAQGEPPLPMLAQVAVAQAERVAANVVADLEDRPTAPFRYRSKGTLVSLGQWYAVGEVFDAHLRGRFAWWLWRTVYLFKFISWKKRFRIAFEWTINLFVSRDTVKIG